MKYFFLSVGVLSHRNSVFPFYSNPIALVMLTQEASWCGYQSNIISIPSCMPSLTETIFLLSVGVLTHRNSVFPFYSNPIALVMLTQEASWCGYQTNISLIGGCTHPPKYFTLLSTFILCRRYAAKMTETNAATKIIFATEHDVFCQQ
jgi:hypothetical protein